MIDVIINYSLAVGAAVVLNIALSTAILVVLLRRRPGG